MNNKITVISVLYFSKDIVEYLINNIKSTIRNVNEIILVNNSPEEIIENNYENVKFISKGVNIGYGAAINYALKFSNNENIIILNPDIIIEKFEFDFEKYENKLFIASGIEDSRSYYNKFPTLISEIYKFSISKCTKIFDNNISRLFQKKINKTNSINEISQISGAFIITNKLTFNSLKGFDENFFLFYEETDLCFRAFSNKIKIFISADCIFSHGIHQTSNVSTKQIKQEEEIKSLIYYFKKHYGKRKSKILCNIIYFINKFYFLMFHVLSISLKSGKFKEHQIRIKLLLASLKKYSREFLN